MTDARQLAARACPWPLASTIVHETLLGRPRLKQARPSHDPCPRTTEHQVRSRYERRMALVGYARVSTGDQHPRAQTDALSAAGCNKVFVDQAPGTLAKRPALEQALDYLRPGDTLVITRLDRLGRSVRNLKALADDLQTREVGLRALSQGIDTTTPAAGYSFTCSPRSPSSSTTGSSSAPTTGWPPPGLAAVRGPQFKMTPNRAKPARATYDDRTAHRAGDRRHLQGLPTHDLPAPGRPRPRRRRPTEGMSSLAGHCCRTRSRPRCS